MDLIWPSIEALPSYADALRQGWSPDTMRPETATDQLAEIDRDPVAFIESLVDREAAGPPIPLPDGTFGQRLPGYHKWMWDGEFCGSIGFRWQRGTTDLPPHVSRPHRLQRRAVEAPAGICHRGAAARSFPTPPPRISTFVEITTDPDNIGSQRVIEANGGVLLDGYEPDPVYGVECKLRYRIDLRPVNVAGT